MIWKWKIYSILLKNKKRNSDYETKAMQRGKKWRQENGGDDYNNDYKRYQLFWFYVMKSCKRKTEKIVEGWKGVR